MAPDLSSLLLRAQEAAHLAGAELRPRTVDWLAVDSDAGHDVKLAADRRSEAILAQVLAATGLPIFSEEAGWIDGGADAADFWLIDPLDGTANYSCGVPLCCVSIGLMRGGRPCAGVIYDFNRDEMFVGASRQGASLNGAPIRVSAKASRQVAILSTGLPVRADYSDQAMAAFARDIPHWKKVRMVGSAALSLAYVACGRFDAYREQAIMLWDVAAGWALVEAAGGVVRADVPDLGRPIDVFASNAALAAAHGRA
ncbi:MAG TPA: inositol monophosphatase family protein [Xanthobacteraceae bacterium]|nr:inositol monophosphatase family protein [Xanthobacteraceae bacterium]